MRIVQGTFSIGFGGLEMVILEFHQWLVEKYKADPNLFAEPWLFAAEGTRFAEEVRSRGLTESTVFLPAGSKARKVFVDFKKRMDTPQTAFLFHRQQALKALAFGRTQGKVSLLCHTFYGVQKKDLWHQYLFSKVNQWIVLTEQHKQNVMDKMGVAEKKYALFPMELIAINLNHFVSIQFCKITMTLKTIRKILPIGIYQNMILSKMSLIRILCILLLLHV